MGGRGGEVWRHTHPSPPHISVITGNILITTIRFARYHLLLASNSFFMTDSLYLGTIQISRNLNERYYYLTSTKSMIWQIDASCSPFQSLNTLPFHIRLERFKLIYYVLISNFSKYYFKTGAVCFFFIFTCIYRFRIWKKNRFGILLWEIVKAPDHNEIKPPNGKIFQKYKPIRHYYRRPQK